MFVVRKGFQGVLHFPGTAQSFVRGFVTGTQIGQNKYKLNNLSLCVVMESLQVNKEQIQLVISPDNRVSQKKNWGSSAVLGRDQILNTGR